MPNTARYLTSNTNTPITYTMKGWRFALSLVCVTMAFHIWRAAPSVNASLILAENPDFFSNLRALRERQHQSLPRTIGHQDDEEGKKLSLERCVGNADCHDPRRCYEFNQGDEGEDSEFTECKEGPCYCFTQDEVSDENVCDKNTDCDNDECYKNYFCPKEGCEENMVCDGLFACMKAAKGIPRCIRLEILVDNGGKDTSYKGNDGPALSLDSCKSNADCRRPRFCFEYNGGDEEELAKSETCKNGPCICLMEQEERSFCTKNTDCEAEGMKACSNSTNGLPICLRIEVLKSRGEGEGGGVCVASKHLGGFEDKELVFETHKRAAVLCDERGNCATPGHMVVWKGQGMMMRRYCGYVGCVPRVMMVNSPKWRRNMAVPSESEGLTFSAFAARYETKAEEVVLSAFIRAGV